MLPAKADRTEKQNALVDQYYAEYAALGLDLYQLDAIQQAVYSDNSLSAAEADARLHALHRLEADAFEFEPACCE